MAASIAETEVLEALREVIDPEVGLNVVDLGLVYGVTVAQDRVTIDLAVTTPACPLGEHLSAEAEAAVRRRLPGAAGVDVRIVRSPPWDPQRMSAEAKRLLGWSKSP